MAAPDNAPPIAELVKIGLGDLRVWAIKFDPPLDARGVSRKHRAVKWKGCATPLDQGGPMIIAIRDTAEEADRDVRLAFWAHYSTRPKFSSQPAAKPKRQPAAVPDDGDDLI